MGNCFFTFFQKDIISEKSLIAVQSVVQYLKENVIQRDIFRATRRDGRVQQIARELSKGGQKLYRILEESSVRDIAGGLVFFLIFLRKPLIPVHIQALVLDIDNSSVCPEIVAQDVLGLLSQEIDGRQAILVTVILDLLHHILKYSPTDELAGCNVPISMMPIFFNLQPEHIQHWRRVATIFVELIRLAPQHLNINNDEYGNGMDLNGVLIQNFLPQDNIIRTNQQRFLDMNAVLRRYLLRTGNRGDSSIFEIYQQRPRMAIHRHR